MSPDSSGSFRQITDVLAQSLQQAFDDVCPKRYGTQLVLTRADDAASPKTVTFTIDGPDAITLAIHVKVTHVGGNVYDIVTQVEDGDPRRFTYSEPASSGSSLSIAPYLGKKIAKHVLNEVEKRLGKKILRNQMAMEMA
jgi:hypothetical protein